MVVVVVAMMMMIMMIGGDYDDGWLMIGDGISKTGV